VLSSWHRPVQCGLPRAKLSHRLSHRPPGTVDRSACRVVPLLRSAGHDTLAPTLTGLGERAHLRSPKTGRGPHVEDVLGVLHYEDLREVVLVDHNYGGMVITGWPSAPPSGWPAWSTWTPSCLTTARAATTQASPVAPPPFASA
jgi:hypothetical protein